MKHQGAICRQLKRGIEYQKIPPNMHMRNPGEKAVSTFKNHFKAILAGVDQTFPMNLWNHLLLQAESTFNMMLQTNVAPMMSAYAFMYEQHDYNKTPMTAMGCTALIHIKSDIRKTWDGNAIDGYYLGTSQEHYRCYKVWVKQTWSVRAMDMANFKHQYITMPT